MKTIIKIDNIEMFKFDNSKTFTLGEEVQCYGKPYIVVSIERRKLNITDKEEVIVTIEKKEIYNSVKITSNEFKNYGITLPKQRSKSVTIATNGMSNNFNRNPFETVSKTIR